MTTSRSGSLLINTLWLVTILSLLAIAIARYLSLEIRLTTYRAAREQAAILARDGVYLAMQRLAVDANEGESLEGTSGRKPYDWLGDEWAQITGVSGSEPSRQIIITIDDEQRKLNLNAATAGQLTQLTGSARIAEEILDASLAKHGPFAVPEELGDLPEMTPEAYNGLRESTTPYTTLGEPLNLNTVTPEVLRALGLSESAVQLVARFREGPDGALTHEQDGVFQEAGLAVLETLTDEAGVNLAGTSDGALLSSALFGVASNTFTIVSEGRIKRPAARVRVEAVVRRAGCPDKAATCVIAWRES